MFTKFLVAAVALMAASVATVPAQAKTNVDVNIGFGGGYYETIGYGGYSGGGTTSCRMAWRIIRNSGFYKVRPIECGGTVLTFKGKRYGQWYRIKATRWSIIDVDPIW